MVKRKLASPCYIHRKMINFELKSSQTISVKFEASPGPVIFLLHLSNSLSYDWGYNFHIDQSDTKVHKKSL